MSGWIHRAALAAAVAAAAVVVPACISNDVSSGGLPPMCKDSSDCDQAHGEICDEGVCWGDPPEGVGFAAVLVPPPDRTDLPVATVPALAISPDGTIGGLAFPAPVNIHGRVLLACSDAVTAPLTCGDTASVGAQNHGRARARLRRRTAAEPHGGGSGRHPGRTGRVLVPAASRPRRRLPHHHRARRRRPERARPGAVRAAAPAHHHRQQRPGGRLDRG